LLDDLTLQGHSVHPRSYYSRRFPRSSRVSSEASVAGR
jgi:hypothetical protein